MSGSCGNGNGDWIDVRRHMRAIVVGPDVVGMRASPGASAGAAPAGSSWGPGGLVEGQTLQCCRPSAQPATPRPGGHGTLKTLRRRQADLCAMHPSRSRRPPRWSIELGSAWQWQALRAGQAAHRKRSTNPALEHRALS